MTSLPRRYNRTLDLTNARVVITGATSGIGKACAFRFAELKCKLILIGRDEQKLQALAEELWREAINFNVSTPSTDLYKLDVCEVDQIADLARHIGPIHILINNAGCNLGGDSVDAVKKDDMSAMVTTNYLAPMAFVSAFAPMMKTQGSGHIINITSTAANDVYPNSSVYCSTKAALSAYTVAARHDLVDTSIRVSSISPGLVKTDLHSKKLSSSEKADAVFENIEPLKPEDVADQIVYVATRPAHVQIADISSYCTNQSHSGVGGVPGVARVGENLGSKSSTPRTAAFGSDREDESNTPPTPGSGRSSPNVPRLNLAGIEQVRLDSHTSNPSKPSHTSYHGPNYNGWKNHGPNYNAWNNHGQTTMAQPYYGSHYNSSNYHGPNRSDDRSKSPNHHGFNRHSSNYRAAGDDPWGNHGRQDWKMQHPNQPRWPNNIKVLDMGSSPRREAQYR